MKIWIIKKETCSDSTPSPSTVGGANFILALLGAPNTPSSSPVGGIAPSSLTLSTIPKSAEENDDLELDHTSPVDYDLLLGLENLVVNPSSEQVTIYSDLTIPLGSVCSAFSSRLAQDELCDSQSFQVIIDSGCKHHMMSIKDSFSYKAIPNAFVNLADKK